MIRSQEEKVERRERRLSELKDAEPHEEPEDLPNTPNKPLIDPFPIVRAELKLTVAKTELICQETSLEILKVSHCFNSSNGECGSWIF